MARENKVKETSERDMRNRFSLTSAVSPTIDSVSNGATASVSMMWSVPRLRASFCNTDSLLGGAARTGAMTERS